MAEIWLMTLSILLMAGSLVAAQLIIKADKPILYWYWHKQVLEGQKYDTIQLPCPYNYCHGCIVVSDNERH